MRWPWFQIPSGVAHAHEVDEPVPQKNQLFGTDLAFPLKARAEMNPLDWFGNPGVETTLGPTSLSWVTNAHPARDALTTVNSASRGSTCVLWGGSLRGALVCLSTGGLSVTFSLVTRAGCALWVPQAMKKFHTET